jgi:hypothetical protein
LGGHVIFCQQFWVAMLFSKEKLKAAITLIVQNHGKHDDTWLTGVIGQVILPV